MIDVYNLIWFLSIAIIVFSLMFFSLQRLDYSNIFKANSTVQIKIFIIFVSLAVACAVALGISKIIELISALL